MSPIEQCQISPYLVLFPQGYDFGTHPQSLRVSIVLMGEPVAHLFILFEVTSCDHLSLFVLRNKDGRKISDAA